MNLDYPTLDALRRQNPAWRLLAADHAPLIASFLQRASDEVHFDLTPATERAQSWLSSLTEREFVGTESRLPEEAAVFNSLRDNRLQPRLRLEQEGIGFGWLRQALSEETARTPHHGFI